METTFKMAIRRFIQENSKEAQVIRKQSEGYEEALTSLVIKTKIPESFVRVHIDEIRRMML